jgi:predicted nucleic acid-binding protein
LTPDQIASGARVFVDAPVFVYHFTGVSRECKTFLERCEAADVDALTSSVVVAEVAHRLMTLEAVAEGLVTPGNVVTKLRRRPDVVRKLRRYQDQVEKIPLMSVKVVAVDSRTLLRSASVRSRYGLLVNDSLVVTSAIEHDADALISSDRDFERVDGLALYCPGDLATPVLEQ